MMRIYFIMILFALCVACSRNKIPGDVIPPDKMKLVMWDMIRAGEFAEYKLANDSLRKQKYSEMFQQIYKIHGINKNSFDKSFKYYEQHPNLNKILLDSIAAYATRQRQNMYKRYE